MALLCATRSSSLTAFKKRGGRANDAVAAAVRLKGLFEFLVLALQLLRVRFVFFVDVEQLADQGGQDFQQGDVVVQRAGAVAGAQAGEYAEGAVVGGYRQGDEHGLFGRHVFAQDSAAEEQGVVAHVVGHNHVGMFQYGTGDAFVGRVVRRARLVRATCRRRSGWRRFRRGGAATRCAPG